MSKKYPGGFVTALGSISGNSVAFDGSGDYLTVSNNAAFQFGTGAFTVEFWLNTTDTAFNIIGLTTASVGNWMAVVLSSNFFWQDGYATTNLMSTPCSSILNGAWNHVAITRTGTSFRVFFNGVQQGSSPYTDTTNYNGTGALVIGFGANGDLQGNISNLRIVKGTALYTANFTPPTQLLNIPNTSLLTCNSPAIVDQSSNNFAITVTGNAAVSTLNPFAFVGNVGRSVAFDGSGDFLNFTNINIGTGNFTFETWVYPTATTHLYPAVVFESGSLLHLFGFANAPGGSLGSLNGIFAASTRPGGGNSWFTAPIISANRWTHIAYVRSGTTVSIYVNGVSQTLDTSFGSNTGRSETTNVTYIATSAANETFAGGYLSNTRINATAVYTANFNPPTQLLNISNTRLLTCNSPAIVDQSSNNVTITVNGNTVVSTLTPFSALSSNLAPTSSARTASANGVWTLDQAMQYTQQGVWPTADTYYIGLITSVGGTGSNADAIAVDGSKNLYIGGYVNNSLGAVIKIAASGQLLFQKTASISKNTTGIAVDNTGNLYMSTYDFSGSPPNGPCIIYKSDPSGTVAWARTLTSASGTGFNIFSDVALDAAQENVYAVGRVAVSGVDTFVLVKYNASGTLQWQRGLTGDGSRVRVGQDGFIYTIGLSGRITKYDASGTLQSQFVIADAAGGGVSVINNSIFIDASSNMYVSYGASSSGVMNKINSSGVIQWTRSLGTANQTVYRDVVVAASGNVYAAGSSSSPSGGSSFTLVIVKYDANGTLQWQRTLTSVIGLFTLANTITLDQQENIYVGGYVGNDMLYAKFPADGSLTGTYSVGGVSVTYAASTLAVASRAATISPGTENPTSPSTAATGFEGLNNSSLTSSVTTF